MIPGIAAARAQLEIDDKTLHELYKKAAKADGPDRDALVQQAGELAQKLAEAEIPRAVRLLADDTTPERLEILLAENGGRMGVLSAEGGVFDIMAGRYAGKGRSGNFEVFLKGHAGDDLRVDRVGRPPVFIRRPALTLGLAVQPEVIRSLGAIPGSRGRGLLGRFLYAMPPSIVGRRVVDPPPVPQAVRQAYRAKMKALLELSAGTDQQGEPAGKDQEGEPAERVLTLAEPAYSCWLEFAAWVEPRLADFGPLADMADWAGKLPGAVARLAGLLHLADRAGESAPWGTPIPADTMARAIRIGRYLIPHARAAFDMMGLDPLVADARYVLAWVRRRAAGPVGFEFTKRDAFEGTKGRFKQVTDLELALGLLEKHHYIRMLPAEPRPGRGRPPSPTYEVNPLALDAGDHPWLGDPAPISANCANSASPGELQNGAADLISANCANSANPVELENGAADLISANYANSASSNSQQDEAPTPEPDGEEEGYEEEGDLMTLEKLLADLRGRGVALAVDGDDLRFRAPRGVLTAADRAALAERKTGDPRHPAGRARGSAPGPLSSSSSRTVFTNNDHGGAQDRGAWPSRRASGDPTRGSAGISLRMSFAQFAQFAEIGSTRPIRGYCRRPIVITTTPTGTDRRVARRSSSPAPPRSRSAAGRTPISSGPARRSPATCWASTPRPP